LELLFASNQKKLVAAFQLFSWVRIYDAVAVAFDTDDTCSGPGAQLQLDDHLSCGLCAALDFDGLESCFAQEGWKARSFLQQRRVGGLGECIAERGLRTRVELHRAPVEEEAGNRHDHKRDQEHVSRRQQCRTEQSNKQHENACSEDQDRAGDYRLEPGIFRSSLSHTHCSFGNKHGSSLDLSPNGHQQGKAHQQGCQPRSRLGAILSSGKFGPPSLDVVMQENGCNEDSRNDQQVDGDLTSQLSQNLALNARTVLFSEVANFLAVGIDRLEERLRCDAIEPFHEHVGALDEVRSQQGGK
jgi:hypothetical protein